MQCQLFDGSGEPRSRNSRSSIRKSLEAFAVAGGQGPEAKDLDLCAYVNGVALDFNSWASNPQRGHRSLQREPPHGAPEPSMVPDP